MLRVGILLILAAVAALVWWRFFHIARPAVLPLSLSPDDPLIAAARVEARASLSRFRELLAAPYRAARVKVPFVSSAGETEYLWADLLTLGENQMAVRYLTPPVTHTGRLERLHTHPLADLEDWVVELPTGQCAGGFSMRVMFRRAREQWGDLPPHLAVDEVKYRPGPGNEY